jgi:hypothetical protein
MVATHVVPDRGKPRTRTRVTLGSFYARSHTRSHTRVDISTVHNYRERGKKKAPSVRPGHGCGVQLRRLLSSTALGIAAFFAFGAIEARAEIRIAGPEQVVFDWATQRCDDSNIPDLPARAFRSSDGRVHLWLSHFQTRSMTGSDLDHLQVDCSINFAGLSSGDPAAYSDQLWLASPYTTDGKTIYALVHAEYQGWRHALCPARSIFGCWYNAITLARSTDGGRTFSQASAPGDLVATMPVRYVPGAGPVGLFEPSNIVLNPRDGYYYAISRTMTAGNAPQGNCLMRTKTLVDPTSWRGWNGSSFSVTFVDPYRQRTRPLARHLCVPIAHDVIRTMTSSLTYNTYLKKFILVGNAVSIVHSKRVWGVYYSTSSDMINWSPRQLIIKATFPWSYICPGPDPIHYPSLLDPASTSRSFDTTGQRPYLYFTRLHYLGCVATPDRDLVRVPIVITK